MDTRILRMCDRRRRVGDNRPRVWRVRGLGQLQPVLIGMQHGRVTLSIEGASGGRPCWWRYSLPAAKAAAKAAFGELERCKAEGRPSAARAAWEARRSSDLASNRPMAAAGLISYRYRGATGFVMIGALDQVEALREAARSITGAADPARLEIWSGEARAYVAVGAA